MKLNICLEKHGWAIQVIMRKYSPEREQQRTKLELSFVSSVFAWDFVQRWCLVKRLLALSWSLLASLVSLLWWDSLCTGITSWVDNWKTNGWRTSSGASVINKEDFERLDNLAKDIEIQWVSSLFLVFNDILNMFLVKT